MIGQCRWILVPVLLAAIASAGPDAPEKAEKAPPLNAKVVEYAKAQLGRQVGDGECASLAIGALQYAGAQPGWFGDPKGDYTWGREVKDLKDALPGDILQFRDAVFLVKSAKDPSRVTSRHAYPHHTAIVARVERDGGLITVYQQNVDDPRHPDAGKNVVESEIPMDALQPGGWVKAYRPVAPANKARRRR